MKKVFIDANIVLDFLDGSRRFHGDSLLVFEKIIDEEWTAVISEDLLTTIYYIVKDKMKVLEFFKTILEYWEIASFGKDTISRAVEICSEDPALDFEDVNQSLCACKSNCHLIISNDKSFCYCGIPVIGAKEF